MRSVLLTGIVLVYTSYSLSSPFCYVIIMFNVTFMLLPVLPFCKFMLPLSLLLFCCDESWQLTSYNDQLLIMTATGVSIIMISNFKQNF